MSKTVLAQQVFSMIYDMKTLDELINSIKGPCEEAAREAEKRQAMLAKPPGSLGRLEELSVRLAAISGKIRNKVDKKMLLVFASDNGVVSEGVASAPKTVTYSQTVNLSRGKTGAAVIAKRLGCCLRVFDVGVDADIKEPGVIVKKIAYGTADIMKGPAMTREQAVRAILTGVEAVIDAVNEGAQVIGIGEMGIGNTTTSSAIISTLTGKTAKEVTGRGGGITDEAYDRKIRVIETALKVNAPDPDDMIDTLSKIGGFDIAAMAGAYLGAASMRVPAVIDGLPSSVAALVAVRICSDVRTFIIPSHASFEIGSRAVTEELMIKPLFDFGMRLGEGSGCPIAMMCLEAACAVMNEMATFKEAEIDDRYLDPIRKTDSFTVKDDRT